MWVVWVRVRSQRSTHIATTANKIVGFPAAEQQLHSAGTAFWKPTRPGPSLRAQAAANLASDLPDLGELEEAVRLGRGTLRRLRRCSATRYPMTLQCATNLV